MTGNNDDSAFGDRAWVAGLTGGEVTRFQRIAGGGSRTTFMVDVKDTRGAVTGFVLQRSATGPYADTDISSLPREAGVYRELHSRGFAIPNCVGVTPDRKAMLSERVAGSDSYHDITDAGQRQAVTDDLVIKIAQLHAINPRELGIEDLPTPRNPNLARSRLQVWLDLFNRFVTRPAPVVRFALSWMLDHAPDNSGDAVVCHGDLGPGNFLFDGDRVTALLDWELVHLGDRHDDLAMMAVRGFQMGGMGDLDRALSVYETHAGVKVDRTLLGYYRVATILLGLATSLTALDRQQVGRVALPLYFHIVPYFQYLLVSALSDWSKVAVVEPELPGAPAGSSEDEVLATLIEELADSTRHPPSSLSMPGLQELALHLQARRAYGDAIDRAELDDLAALLGKRPAAIEEGLRALDNRLRDGRLDHDDLLRWSYRHTRRQALLWPAWRERFVPLLPL